MRYQWLQAASLPADLDLRQEEDDQFHPVILNCAAVMEGMLNTYQYFDRGDFRYKGFQFSSCKLNIARMKMKFELAINKMKIIDYCRLYIVDQF